MYGISTIFIHGNLFLVDRLYYINNFQNLLIMLASDVTTGSIAGNCRARNTVSPPVPCATLNPEFSASTPNPGPSSGASHRPSAYVTPKGSCKYWGSILEAIREMLTNHIIHITYNPYI